MKLNISIVTFGEHNECEVQDGIRPDCILYCGLIDEIKDSLMGRSTFLLKEINAIKQVDERYVLFIKEMEEKE